MRNERGRRLREFLRDEGVVFGYEYDFGNGWEHDIVFFGTNPLANIGEGSSGHNPKVDFYEMYWIGRTFKSRLRFGTDLGPDCWYS
jgi:hypothetical protein